MRVHLSVISFLVLSASLPAFAQSPQFPRITITGEADPKFNQVSLFEGGSSSRPFKTEYLRNGRYSIDIRIPGDMRKQDDAYVTDMRFWGDKNGNGIKGQGEPVSECHFIVWVPSAQKTFMQIYQGGMVPITSSVLRYNYPKK